MDDRAISREVSEGNKEHAIGNWWKVDPYYIVLEGIAETCPVVVWTAELVNDELGYSAETSKISVQGAVKMQEETETLREELLNKNEPGFNDLRNPQSVEIAKDAKIMRSTVRKINSHYKAKSVAAPQLAGASKQSKVQLSSHRDGF